MIFSLIAALGLGALARASDCRCLYGEECWPADSHFTQLESQVSQHLIHPLPPASPCYPTSDPSGNCSYVTENWHDGNWRSGQDGAMQITLWETSTFKNGTIDACYLNSTITKVCDQGSVPVIGVDARGPADIQAAVNFAVEHNLRLVVKNTGHDVMGRSTARGSFLVWTHNMKDITYNSSFVPEGAPQADTYGAITLGAGVQWHEAFDAIEKQGRVMVGGAAAQGSLGAAGGWVQGGGHSSLAPSYGLGVDNVLEMGVVVSTGEYLIVNSYQHSDLFWALRGGGGGTYGIVTHVTYRTFPSVALIATFFQANTTNAQALKTLFTEYTRIHPALSDAGWSGYGMLRNPDMSLFYIAPNVSWAEANKTFDPFFGFTQSLTSQGIAYTAFTRPFSSWYEWYSLIFGGPGPLGATSESDSRLISRKSVESNYQQLAETLFDIPGGVYINLVSGGEVSRVDPDSVGVTPAWRDALIEAVWPIAPLWKIGASSSEIAQAIAQFKASSAAVAAITPGAGAYLNEASIYEVDSQQTFFGSHYETLRAIKDLYDPKHLFVVTKGVGSEEWDDELICRL